MPVLQAVDVDSPGHRQAAGKLFALQGLEAVTHVARAPDVGLHAVGQGDERRHPRDICPAEFRRHGSHRRIARPVVAVVGSTSQRIARLQGDGRMIACRTVDRPHDGQLVHDRGLQRQMLANLDAGDSGRNGPVGAANLGRRIRLGIPHVDVAGTARQPEQDHRFLAGRGSAGCCGRCQGGMA